jgi:hypothetical protein
MSFRTRPVFSDRQIVQTSVESITLSGTTNFHGVLKSKGVEIDGNDTNAMDGHTLTYNGTKIELFDSIGFNDNRYVRYDINNQPQLINNPTNRLNARTNIQAVSKDTNDSRIGDLTNTGNVDIIGNLSLSNNSSIDNINLGETLNIGTSNSNIINIGNNNTVVNIQGSLLYQNVTDLEVTDKLIRLNKGGSIGSGSSSGFEIEENNVVTGFLKTNANRTGWSLKSPASQELNLGLNLLSETRTQTFQNQNGIIALIGIGDLDDRYIRSINVGNLSPIFTTSVSGLTPTETISFNLSNAGANTFFGNNTSSSALPSYNQLQALTRIDDTNVTLTLSGNTATALAKAVNITVGWNGVLAVGRGGTGISSYTANNYIRALNSSTLEQRTPSQVLGDINGVVSTRTLTLSGTTNQINVSSPNTQDLSADRSWTLSLPQDIHTGATPTFAGLTVNGTTTTNTLVVGTQASKATINYITNNARTLTIPSLGGNRTFAFINEAQTFSAIQTFSSQLVSSVATGTAPFSVASTTRVVNLNVARAGTADVWTTARDFTIGNTTILVDGSTTYAWTLNDIGAEPSFLKGNITTSLNHPITITNGTGRLVGSTTATISHSTSGWTNKTNLTNATVISNLTVDTFGHISNWTTRNITLANLGYTGATNADNYQNWLLASGGATGAQSITSGTTVSFLATPPILVARSGGTITYSHANSGVSAGTYNNVTVNATGHVTSGSNVNYLTTVNLGYTEATTQGTVTNNTGGTNAIIPAANTSRAGLITTGSQTIAGSKTFIGKTIISPFTTSTSDHDLVIERTGTNNTTFLRGSNILLRNATSNDQSVLEHNDGHLRILHNVGNTSNYNTTVVFRKDNKVLINTSTEISGQGTLQVSGTGNFTSTVTASNFITTSDKRLKTEIKPLENAIDILSKFTSYEYIKNNQKEAGFIAQEVKEHIPYSVFENNEGYLTMSDRPILAYLHKAVLELKNELDNIKSKLN